MNGERSFVPGFGLYNYSVSALFEPASREELRGLLSRLAAERREVVFRGAGRSYGDAATNPGGPVVALTRLKAIRSFDEVSGVVRAEAGVTFEDLWRFSVPRGFWPPIVPGTMSPTLGGCVAMNIHGKNGWHAGTLGEHLTEIVVADAAGERTLGPADLEFCQIVSNPRPAAAIVEVALRLRRVETGWVDVEAVPTRSLRENLELLDEGKDSHDYAVAWIDCFPRGAAAGRGVIHFADYVRAEGNAPARGLSEAEQVRAGGLADRLPKGLLLAGLRAFTNDPGMRLVNAGKFLAHRLGGRSRQRQSLVAFSFLLDFVPGWRDVYRPGGFIQYQLFLPRESAPAAFERALALQREIGVFSYLGVVKRHRRDRLPFRNPYPPDGFSLALDFPVTEENGARLIRLCRAYDRLVVENGGRFYKAKDSVGSFERALQGGPSGNRG